MQRVRRIRRQKNERDLTSAIYRLSILLQKAGGKIIIDRKEDPKFYFNSERSFDGSRIGGAGYGQIGSAFEPDYRRSGYQMKNDYQQRGGERRLHMKFARTVVSPYEEHVILNNGCPAFIEMQTVKSGTDIDIYYKMTGYTNLGISLKKYELSDIDVLKLTAEVLKLIHSCEDYLIFSEYVSFRADRIFVSSEDQSLKLMYLPGYRTTKTLKALIAAFVDDAAALGTGQRIQNAQGGLLADYKKQVLLNEYGIRGYINLAEDLIRTTVSSSESHNLTSYETAKEKPELEVRDAESEYFTEKVGGIIGVKEKIIHFVDSILS